MILDATKDDTQRMKLEAELEGVGIRLNKIKPNVSITRKAAGGINMTSQVPLTKISERQVQSVMQEYRIFNADVVFRDNCYVDEFIDVLEGNRK